MKLAKINTMKKLYSLKKCLGKIPKTWTDFSIFNQNFYFTSEAHDADISRAKLTWPTFCNVNRLLLIKLSMG